MTSFKGKKLLITGGTGSFGNAVIKRFLKYDIEQIRIFSRDEKKQDEMRKTYNDDRLQFHLGDVRDIGSLRNVMYDLDYIFHAAALKQVPSCEFFPLEAVKTNVIGTDNVLSCAVQEGVKNVVCLSTDKAAYPINAMGISKAMMEKVVIAKGRAVTPGTTTISCTRYGNVMYSRGSVIPLFIHQIKSSQPLTITDPNMTRFIMSLDEAVDLVLFAFEHAQPGDLFIQKAPACTMESLVQAILEIFNPNHPISYIGTRHGEKLYETLLTSEEKIKSIDMGNYFRVPVDSRNLNYEQYFEVGSQEISLIEPYTSHNTTLLSVEEIKNKLLSLEEVRTELEAYVTNTI